MDIQDQRWNIRLQNGGIERRAVDFTKDHLVITVPKKIRNEHVSPDLPDEIWIGRESIFAFHTSQRVPFTCLRALFEAYKISRELLDEWPADLLPNHPEPEDGCWYQCQAYTYGVFWDPARNAHVGLCAEFPELSSIDDSLALAMGGIASLVTSQLSKLYRQKRPHPAPIGPAAITHWFKVMQEFSSRRLTTGVP